MWSSSRLAVVVGHTSGIGAGISDALLADGWSVHGMSRATGDDIATEGGKTRVLDACAKADLLVNNAHAGTAQVDLLYALATLWGDDPMKSVLCVGSRAPDWHHHTPNAYATEKASLDFAVRQLQLSMRWRLMIVRPGYVDTPRVARVTGVQKLDVTRVVDAAMWMLRQPADTLVGRVDIAARAPE